MRILDCLKNLTSVMEAFKQKVYDSDLSSIAVELGQL